MGEGIQVTDRDIEIIGLVMEKKLMMEEVLRLRYEEGKAKRGKKKKNEITD